MNKKRNNLILMCGIPRCGKSSWIKANKRRAIVVSPDEIRKMMFGHQFHAPANRFVFGIAEGMARLLLKQGKDVIIDATHITRGLRESWRPIAEEFDAKVIVVWVYADSNPVHNVEYCQRRNKKSLADERVPDSVIGRMAGAFEEPQEIFGQESWFKLIKYHNKAEGKESKNLEKPTHGMLR